VSQIIDSVLQLSRRDSTRQQRLDLSQWIDSFLDEFHQTLQLDGGRFHVEPDADAGPLQIHFDPTHLHQVLWNLCDNAIKHAAAAVRARRAAVAGLPRAGGRSWKSPTVARA
jgi:two-component system sensor histidine kinase PilS (NtrC family)